jgi:hypothetical protein
MPTTLHVKLANGTKDFMLHIIPPWDEGLKHHLAFTWVAVITSILAKHVPTISHFPTTQIIPYPVRLITNARVVTSRVPKRGV